MRDRENPGDAFDRLAAMNLVALHADDEQARDHITANAHDGEAITVATNDEATALNERIRTGRVESGEVDDTMTATGSDGLPIGAGDLIQTRKNDTALGVANRQQWIVQHVTNDGTVYAREAASGRKNPRTVTLPAEYVGEHAHLSYAATAYGVQGATVGSSHTVLSEATSAAGVYVGMTRGREANWLHVAAADMADARAQFIEAMERDPADRGLDHATRQAAEAVRGLIADGPARLVTEELARLDHETERAERAAERWEQIAAKFDTQRAAHHAEDEETADVLRKVEEAAEQVRAKVAAPLMEQAERDGAAYLAAVKDEAAARGRLAAVGRFGRRKARNEHQAVTEQTQTRRAQVHDAWGGEPPRTDETLPGWATQAAARRAESDPRVTDADRAVETVRAERKATQQRHQRERLAMLVNEYGAEPARRAYHGIRAPNPHSLARDATTRVAILRAEADELRRLPIDEATERIKTKRADQEHQRRRTARRERQLSEPVERDPHSDPRHQGPARGL